MQLYSCQDNENHSDNKNEGKNPANKYNVQSQ